MKALVVDDEEDIGLMISRFLKKEGWDAAYANKIKTADEMISEDSYDIFLLDLNLPDGTGFDLMPTIRKQNQDAVIIVISAYDGIYEMRKADELGVDGFIKKPFTKQQVLETIRELSP